MQYCYDSNTKQDSAKGNRGDVKKQVQDGVILRIAWKYSLMVFSGAANG